MVPTLHAIMLMKLKKTFHVSSLQTQIVLVSFPKYEDLKEQ